MKLSPFIFLLLFLFGTFRIIAQEPTEDSSQLLLVEMQDGSRFIGTVQTSTITHLILETSNAGKVSLLRTAIKSMEEIELAEVINDDLWKPRGGTSRTFLSPTAYSLERGEGFYQNWMLGIQQVAYGITDYFTVELTFELFSLLIDEGNLPTTMLAPKFSFPVFEDKWNIGVVAQLIHVPQGKKVVDLTFIHGVNTFGSRDRNFSIGMGYGIYESQFIPDPLLYLSGNYRTGRRFALHAEAYFLPVQDNPTASFMLGGRYLGKKTNWDFTFIGALVDQKAQLTPIPIIGFQIPF